MRTCVGHYTYLCEGQCYTHTHTHTHHFVCTCRVDISVAADPCCVYIAISSAMVLYYFYQVPHQLRPSSPASLVTVGDDAHL